MPSVPPTLKDRAVKNEDADQNIPVPPKQTVIHPIAYALDKRQEGVVLHFYVSPIESVLIVLSNELKDAVVGELVGGITIPTAQVLLP